MASAPPDPQSPATRRFSLLRALSLPLPLPLPSRTPTPGPDSSAAACGFELNLLEPPLQHDHHLRRRQTATTTTTTAAASEDVLVSRLPWPVQSLGAASPSPHRRSIESCFSDVSSLSSLSESEPRATPARSRVRKVKTREAESEAIWREHWI